MLSYVHDRTTIWRLWDPDRKRVIQASNVRFDELAKTEESAESIRLDPFEIENGDADTCRQVDADANRQVEADTPRQADADTPRQRGAGEIVNELPRRTERYNLRKRP